MRLRLATLNVWGLPWGLAADLERRVQAIGARLPRLGLDLLALEEVWTAESLARLTAAGRAAGLAHSWHHRRGPGGSGLLLLSRLPLARARFEAFEVRGLPERLWHGDYHAGKGFGELRVETEAGPLHLLLTHLHAQYGADESDLYRPHRMAQVVQLAVRSRELPGPLVATGDFNLREDQDHHRVLTGLTGLRDAAAELDRRQPTLLADNPYRGGNEPEARIDYVFVRDGRERGLRVRRAQRIFDGPLEIGGHRAAFSDHAGLVVDLELVPGGAELPPPALSALARARVGLEEGRRSARARRGERRLWAGAGLAGGLLALALRRSSVLTRRGALGALSALGAVSLPLGLGAGTLAGLASPEEIASFERVRRRLDALSGDGSATG